jgi:hypothetical protein
MFSGFFVLDCVTTWVGIQFFWMYEVNPLLSWIYGIMGIYAGLLAYKIAVVLFAVLVEHYLSTLELDYSKENTVIEKWKRVLIKIADTRTILYGIGIGGYFATIFNIINFSGAI